MWRSFLFLAALMMPGVAHASEKSIVGNWYEEATYGGYRTISIAHFHADGSFTVEFRKCVQPGELDSIDTGTWTYAAGTLRMITQARDGFWVFDIEDYQTSSNDGQVWVYRSVSGSGEEQYGHLVFRDVRVTATSKVPRCDLNS